jgi:Exostosin family
MIPPGLSPERVLITSAGPANGSWEDYPRQLLLESAGILRAEAMLTDDPQTATLIIFASVAFGGLWMRRLVRHPLTRRFPDKIFVYSEADHPWPILRGIYTSAPVQLFDPERHRTGPYLPFHHTAGLANRLQSIDPIEDPRYLYSFVGAVASAPACRAPLMQLDDIRALLFDTSDQRWAPFYGRNKKRRAVFDRYVGAFAHSAFVLCPRGSGTSSIRLFEAMSAGRVPVIIADDWVPPVGPSWPSFSLLVAESDVANIPQLLRKHEPLATEFGLRAREAWEQWFSPSVIFGRAVEWCAQIRDDSAIETTGRRQMWAARSLRGHRAWTELAAEARHPIRPTGLET